MQKIKKPISILLSVLMVLSVFAVVPFAASAAELAGRVDVRNLSVGDILGGDVQRLSNYGNYTLTLEANRYGDYFGKKTEATVTSSFDFTEAYGSDPVSIFDMNGYNRYYPYDENGNRCEAFIVTAVDHSASTFSLAGYREPDNPVLLNSSVKYRYCDGTAFHTGNTPAASTYKVDTGNRKWANNTWYVVTENVTFEKRIEISGTVNLVLCDGATLTAKQGISVNGGGYNISAGALNIYAQNGGTGALYAGTANGTSTTMKDSPQRAAIGGDANNTNGDITIHGGNIYAISNIGTAGIGGGQNSDGGNVTIYGGNVTAGNQNSYGSGIGGGYYANAGNINILGGTVTAFATGQAYDAAFGSTVTGRTVNLTIPEGATMVAGNNADSAVATTVDEYKANRKIYARVEAGNLPDYYTVEWKNYDGTNLGSGTEVLKNANPTYTGEEPARAEDEQNTYTFSGWTSSNNTFYAKDATLPAVTGDETYTATFDAVPFVASVTADGTTTRYTDFGTALNAWADGSTLTLLADVQMGSPVNVSGTRTLDLNGYGIKVTVVNQTVFNVSGNLTLNDSDATKIHKFDPPSGTAGLATLNEESGSLEIHGGYITGFKGVTRSYLFNVSSSGSFTINGGNLIGNEGTQKVSYNGTVVISASGDLTINGGAIIYNKSGYWGTAISAGCTLKINGGTIAHNYAAQSTAGIYCWYLEMTGGSVTDNVAATTGQSAGITVYYHATFSGNPVIKDNTDSTGASNLNVYMQTKCSAISSNLGENACIGITMSNPGVFTDSSDTSFNDPTKFFSDKSNYIVGKNAAGQLLLGVPRTVTWKMDDGSVIDTTTVANGCAPTHDVPTKEADTFNNYTFAGWKNGNTTYAPGTALPAVTGDATYTATFTAVEKPKLFWKHSVTLGGDIGVNFYLNPEVLDTYNGAKTVTFTWDGNTQTVDVPATADANGYKVTCNVVAAQMAHKIHAVVKAGGTALAQTDDYSVQDYAEKVYNNPASVDPEKPDEIKALAKAMLNYGAMAQTVFADSLTEAVDLPTGVVGVTDFSGVTANDIAAAIKGSASDLNTAAADFDAEFYTSSLIYLSRNTLRLYFTPASKTVGALNGLDFSGNLSEYYYFKDVENIPAAELDNQQTFSVNGTEFTFSALDYAKAVVESTKMDDDQKNLAKSLYLYNMTANDYFDAAPAPAQNIVDLSTLTAAYEAQDGDVLTGVLGGDYQITIADGATVTLKDADITCLSNNVETANFAGITLLGDATIMLEGANTVKGGYQNYPGIFVPENTTLTIDGEGSLDASSNGYGCGIGGGNGKRAGNIIINGGTITATGGQFAAGIGGGGGAQCGDITITGGTVTANGGRYGSGIGGSYYAKCGNISIANTVTSVTATKGNDAPNSIGAGKSGTCGTVTIGGVEGAITQSPYTYEPN